MNIQDPILSLCIPTYNRADVLDVTLSALFSDSGFDASKIEIVVSDNCSDDHTSDVVAKYPLVRYYRNETNIRDSNFSLALQRGKGEYLKLMNDTVRMRPGGLARLLAVVEANIGSKYPLFVIEQGGWHARSGRLCRTLGEFIDTVSFRTTWIGNFGVWRRDMTIVADITASSSQLLQVEWAFRIAAMTPVNVCRMHYCTVVTLPVGAKGGYSVFRVFLDNYLGLIRRYLDQDKIEQRVYDRAKYRIFKRYIAPRIEWLLTDSEEISNFDNEGAWEIIMRNYGDRPYFYWRMLCASLRRR